MRAECQGQHIKLPANTLSSPRRGTATYCSCGYGLFLVERRWFQSCLAERQRLPLTDKLKSPQKMWRRRRSALRCVTVIRENKTVGWAAALLNFPELRNPLSCECECLCVWVCACLRFCRLETVDVTWSADCLLRGVGRLGGTGAGRGGPARVRTRVHELVFVRVRAQFACVCWTWHILGEFIDTEMLDVLEKYIFSRKSPKKAKQYHS